MLKNGIFAVNRTRSVKVGSCKSCQIVENLKNYIYAVNRKRRIKMPYCRKAFKPVLFVMKLPLN